MTLFKSKFQIFIEELMLTILSLVKLMLLTKFNKSSRVNDTRECIILANGPSLIDSINENDEFLQSKDLICVNHFPSTAYYEKLKPAIYITSAPDLWLEDIEQKFIDNSILLFDNINEKTTWSLKLFIPYEAKKYQRWQEQIHGNSHIEIVYFNNVGLEGFKWFRHMCFKLDWGMPRPHNVLIPCLMISLNMNYKNISLFGADHSWLKEITVTEHNEVLINQKHFYDRDSSQPETLDKKGVGQRNLYELLYKFMQAFKGYAVIKEYAISKNAIILNATPNSYIDAFDRINLKV